MFASSKTVLHTQHPLLCKVRDPCGHDKISGLFVSPILCQDNASFILVALEQWTYSFDAREQPILCVTHADPFAFVLSGYSTVFMCGATGQRSCPNVSESA